MQSGMKNLPPSWDRGIYNVSVLFGCGVSSRREVGMVSSKDFNKTFHPAISEALCKLDAIVRHAFSVDFKGPRESLASQVACVDTDLINNIYHEISLLSTLITQIFLSQNLNLKEANF